MSKLFYQLHHQNNAEFIEVPELVTAPPRFVVVSNDPKGIHFLVPAVPHQLFPGRIRALIVCLYSSF